MVSIHCMKFITGDTFNDHHIVKHLMLVLIHGILDAGSTSVIIIIYTYATGNNTALSQVKLLQYIKLTAYLKYHIKDGMQHLQQGGSHQDSSISCYSE